jgi:hypothetical protein
MLPQIKLFTRGVQQTGTDRNDVGLRLKNPINGVKI